MVQSHANCSARHIPSRQRAALHHRVRHRAGSRTYRHRQLSIGPGKIVLLPMLWALVIGAVWSLAADRLPAPLQIGAELQRRASTIVQLALLMFIAKLGLLVGGSLPKLATAGWALVFQEFGHFFGTMALGCDCTAAWHQARGHRRDLLRWPRAEPSHDRREIRDAIAEGRGVLAEYITGTIFGTIFIALLASLMTGLAIFNPRALAMAPESALQHDGCWIGRDRRPANAGRGKGRTRLRGRRQPDDLDRRHLFHAVHLAAVHRLGLREAGAGDRPPAR